MKYALTGYFDVVLPRFLELTHVFAQTFCCTAVLLTNDFATAGWNRWQCKTVFVFRFHFFMKKQRCSRGSPFKHYMHYMPRISKLVICTSYVNELIIIGKFKSPAECWLLLVHSIVELKRSSLENTVNLKFKINSFNSQKLFDMTSLVHPSISREKWEHVLFACGPYYPIFGYSPQKCYIVIWKWFFFF